MTTGENPVGIEITHLSDSITKVALTGRLDTPAVASVETRFVANLVPTGKNGIVDISALTFISSMGIRMLLSVGRSMRQRQAKLAVYGAQPLVKETLETVWLAEIIPVVDDESAAIDRVSS